MSFTSPLITADALAKLLAARTTEPTVLDVRWQLATGAERSAYLEGHIPGAAFVDLDRQLADPASARGRHPLPNPERFAAEMRSLGVSAGRPVVVYDAKSATAAARAWWLLSYFGHPAVAVLDGGLAAWIAGGHPLEAEPASGSPGDFVAQPGGMPAITADEVEGVAARGLLIDARATDRFLGLAEPIDRVAGHIPGARNRPTTDNVDSAGRFLDPPELKAAFARLGATRDEPVATYCGSGVTAAHEVLALELAGYRAALYPGSWSEWISDPSRPVARREQPGRG